MAQRTHKRLPIPMLCQYYIYIGTIQAQARNILDSAESSLNDLVHSALRQKRYEEVALVAEALSKVTEVRARLQFAEHDRGSSGETLFEPGSDVSPCGETLTSSPSVWSSSRAEATGGSGPVAKVKAAKYPRFLRDGTRLIKVGWSKKKKGEYLHRVPKEVVFTVVEHLERNVRAESLFEIENLCPILTDSGEEVPSYQIYVIVAWLRQAGVIEKKGRDGYIVHNTSRIKGDFNEHWDSIQAS